MRARWTKMVILLAALLTAGCSRKSSPSLGVATAEAQGAPKPKPHPPPRTKLVAEGPEAEPRVSFVQGRHGRLRLSDGGQGGVPVLFVHGLGSSLDAWQAQLDAIRPHRRAAALDLRGHGESDAPSDDDYSIPALADDVETVIEMLGFDRVHLVGHSMAGEVLTAYAGRHPEKVAGLVYVDAVGDMHRLSREDQDNFIAAGADPRIDQHKVYEEMLGPRARPETRERVLAAVDQVKPGALGAIRRAMVEYAPGDDAARYSGPRTCIDAEGNDSVVDAWALFPGAPRRRVPYVSHFVMMDDPEAFTTILEAFLIP
ncbi:MAG: alpha/beta hydrolase [Byssovorax sp.]